MTALADLPVFDLPAGQVAAAARSNSNGHVVITKAAAMPRPGWLSRESAGGALIFMACVLLAGLAVAMGVTSFHAQLAYIVATRHQRVPSMLEALGLDCGAVIFSLLGISLARLGRRASVERVLVIACALGSCGMNALNADLGSPRSVAVWALPPALFALTSDRLVAVVRRAALGSLADDEGQRSAWLLAGTAVLYALRFAVAPGSTARGARQALLNATPLPATGAPAQLPAASPAALASRHPCRTCLLVPAEGDDSGHCARCGHPAKLYAGSRGPAEVRKSRAGSRQAGPTKTQRLLALAASRHDLAVIDPARVSAIATGLAGEIGLHPGTARRVLLSHVRGIQEAAE